MSDFRKQIIEDIRDYQEEYPNIENIEKDEWAFNYWVLDKLFSVSEDLIEEKIIDYNDKGIDCYVWHEDLHDLYLIQNKFYSEGTALTNDYVQNDFLTRSLGSLEKGTYSRSEELQNIFNKYKDEEDFMVHLHLYVTNNEAKNQKIMEGLQNFNQKHKNYNAVVFDLDDIYDLYYREPKEDRKSMVYDIKTINKATVLSVNNSVYEMTQALDAKYILTPVTEIYEMMKKAEKEEYPIFEDNIREYLGATGSVNKGIMETLKSKSDRNNFFFYNNGITIIADDIDSSGEMKGGFRYYRINDPQIVNGCQTVSTIYETLKGLPSSTLNEEFKNTYVMAKVLKIPNKDKSLKKLYEDIVTYNNSQNSINQKTFVANSSEFIRLQSEFKRKGFLVCIKQSDKHKFKKDYPKATSLLDSNKELVEKFGLENKKATKDFFVDLEKLLQVVLAFCDGAQSAITKKAKILKPSSDENGKVVSFIKNEVTINELLDLYLLYLRAEQEKKKSDSGRWPIPLYLIYCFAHYDCNDSGANISKVLSSKEEIDRIIKLYKNTIQYYYDEWQEKNDERGYNVMIKSPIDMDILSKGRKIYERVD